MKKLKRTLLIALLMMAFIPAIFAFESTISIRVGESVPLNDISGKSDMNLMLGGSYEAWLMDYLSLGLYPYYTKLSGENTDVNGILENDYEAVIIGADLLAKFRPTKGAVINFENGTLTRIAPFIDLGLGIAHNKSTGHYTLPSKAIGTKPEESKFNIVVPSVGAGISFMTKWNVNLDLGVQLENTLSDKVDLLEAGDMNDAYLMPYVSLGYTFGKKAANQPPHQILRNVISMKKDFTLEGVQFEFDSDALTPAAKNILVDVVDQMKMHPRVKLDIQGHCDNVGTEIYNKDLSLRRAESVKNYMVEKGIAAERLGTHGFGTSRPVASNDTDAGRALNRRIEFIIVK